MSDQRIHTRALMPKSVHVIDKMTGEEYAQVINLSESGLLLAGRYSEEKGAGVSRAAMSVGDVVQLELVITALKFNAPIGVECVWAEPQKTNMIFGGFRIIDIATDDLLLLKSLIEQSTAD